ncbi:hypothetical protein SteCoe_5521 [Stentor coeruleus]|uniref:Calponin-homology (CH) domain-containing protein n=1 Tax=Stentor coeruleus TaxID=5963 RepID=A0A1R2CS48_9CILI|nr:hypothetical protein SteCoe_5521 [Stentor coeruleus]
MVDLGECLIQWLNRNELGIQCKSLSDLSDGILLYELMSKVSPEYFDMECISIDVKNNWALKLGNLRRLKKALDKYLEEELKMSHTKLDRIDLPNLARKGNPDDAIKLFEAIFFAIIHCPQKQVYIKRMMELDESAQITLMAFIQKIIGEDNENPMGDSDLVRKEVEILRNDKKKLSKQVLELEQEITGYIEDKARLAQQIQQLKGENERLYTDIEKKSEQEARHSVSLVNELKIRLMEKDEQIADFQKSFDKMKKQYENEIAQLKDDIDVATAKNYQNMNADKTLQQYKKRLESLAGIKQKAADLQKQNENLMETVASQHTELEVLAGLRKQIVQYKEQVNKEKNRADTLSFNLENKEKMIKKYEKEIVEFRQKVSLLESKNQELMLDRQDSSHASEDSFIIQSEKELVIIPSQNRTFKSRQSCLPTAHEQIELTIRELNHQKTMIDTKKLEIKSYKERILMVIEEMHTRGYEYMGVIKQLESNNLILSEQIQVMNESLAEKEHEKVVHEQTMYELEEVKATKATLLNDIKNLYTEKDAIHKKYLDCREEYFVLQASVNSKDMTVRELELELRVIGDKIGAYEQKEKVYVNELASLRRNSATNTGGSQQLMELEREMIALRNDNSELQQRLEQKNKVINEVTTAKEEVIKKLQLENIEIKEKCKQEIEIKNQEFMQQSEEAVNELMKQREQLAAKLQFERRNTMIGWQRAMSIKDPTLLISEEIFKLREALVEKEKEIARVTKNNKELKMCWKDSAKLLKSVWKQLGDETKKIEEAVRKRHG